MLQFGRISLKIIISFISIWIFTKGFLLMRHELTFEASYPNHTTKVKPQKLVIVIIDALRYDFARYQPNLHQDLPYLNQLPILRDIAASKGCSSSRLFKFLADAPTTTMQRIKGFTTGGFPTFIDMSNNFDSSEITEDNLISRFVEERNYKITFLGDDTWMKLFPDKFNIKFPFPSFDVRDLHTVDDGIMHHLEEEILNPDHDVLIAHFLGVDHCGHRFGPNHPKMKIKLKQMNEMIKLIVNKINNESLLLIMGDHGMTQTGDHGGDTDDEISAALFAYSASGAFKGSWRNEEHRNESSNNLCLAGMVQQVDLVPTLASLMKVGIPFSNLGSVITDILPSKEGSSEEWKVVRKNAEQIIKYLTTYNSKHSLFTSTQMKEIKNKYSEAFEKAHVGDSKKLLSIMSNTREICKNLWAKFDILLMGFGLFTFATELLLFICCVDKFVIWNGFLMLCLTVALFDDFKDYILLISLCFGIFLSAVTASSSKHNNSFPKLTFPLLSVGFFLPLSLTSNSFVINEDRMITFFFLSVILWSFYSTMKHQLNRKVVSKKFTSVTRVIKKYSIRNILGAFFLNLRLLGTICVLCLTRYLQNYFICRSEQTWCYNSSQNSSKYSVLLLNIFLLFITIYFIYRFLRGGGNIWKPLSAASIAPKTLLPLASLSIALYWIVQVPLIESSPEVNMLASFAYFLILLSALWWLVSPLDVHLMYPDRHGNYYDSRPPLSDKDLIRMYYQVISKNGTLNEKGMNNTSSTPAAFGLYTLASAAVIGFAEVILLLIIILSETHYIFVYSSFVLVTYLLLELISSHDESNNKNNVYVSWNHVSWWCLSSSFWWFVTGHQASISSIPWYSAYVGYDGSHDTIWLPALMVGSNVFGPQILHTVLLPLLLLWPFSRSSLFMNRKKNKNFESEHSFLLSEEFKPSLEDLITKYITLQGFKLLGCMLSAFLHRRHLMVWKIFAPRFIYEVISFIVVSLCSLAIYLFMIIVNWNLKSWISKINSNIL